MKIVEWMHVPVDDHLKERLDRIFMAKERYAFELKQEDATKKAARSGLNRGSSAEDCDTDSMPPPPVNTQAGTVKCV